MKVDLLTASFGNVVFVMREGKPERAVVVVAARAKSDTATARGPVVYFENPLIGRRDIMDANTADWYSTAEDLAPAAKKTKP